MLDVGNTLSDNRQMARKRQLDTHNRIKECALELFLDSGYAKTSVNDIVAAAKISRATFYLYFGGKDAILREYMDLVWENSRLLYKEFSELPDLSHASVHAWMGRALEAFMTHEKIILLVMQGMPSEILVQTAARESRNAATLMRHGTAWRHFSSDEARCRAHLLIYQLQRGMHEFISGRLKIDRETFLATLADIWMQTLRKRPPFLGAP